MDNILDVVCEFSDTNPEDWTLIHHEEDYFAYWHNPSGRAVHVFNGTEVEVSWMDEDVEPANKVDENHIECSSCHTCPFKTEINYDFSLCHCDDEQTHNCAMDI